MNPTANKAGEMSPPKKKILFPIKVAPSRTPFKTPKNEIKHLKAPPINAPFTIRPALFELSDSSPASRTDAHARPSGYCRLSSFFTIKTCLIGIMNKIPSRPPVKAITVVSIISNSCQTPIIISAGIVKIIPAARDSPAEAAVWI